MNRLGRIWRRIVTFVSALIQMAGVLSAILTILTFLGVGSLGFGYISHALPFIILGAAILLLSVLIFIFLYTLLEGKTNLQLVTANASAATSKQEEKTKDKPISTDTIMYPDPPKFEEVELLLKEIVYEYSPDGQTMWQRKRLQMRALRNGVTHLTDRYRWTGSGKCELRSLTPGFRIINQRKQEIWDYFDVSFPHPLRSGETVDFAIEWELFDEEKNAVPFLSTMIDCETKHLLLRVVLPRELIPKRAYCYEFANYIDTLPVTTNEVQWSPATQSINYDVPHPKKYHKYLIRWYSE